MSDGHADSLPCLPSIPATAEPSETPVRWSINFPVTLRARRLDRARVRSDSYRIEELFTGVGILRRCQVAARCENLSDLAGYRHGARQVVDRMLLRRSLAFLCRSISLTPSASR